METEKDNSASHAEIAALLRAHRINPTQQRVEIAQILLAKSQHLSADQILHRVNHEHTVASRATIYNTLGLLAKKGLINEVVIDPTKVFYDSNVSAHHHFYNIDTNDLMDIEAGQVSIGLLSELPEGTVAAGLEVTIRVRNSR